MSGISKNRPPMKTNRTKILMAMFIAIGIALMTTLAILPNAIGNVHANPCSHNTAGNGGNGGNGKWKWWCRNRNRYW